MSYEIIRCHECGFELTHVTFGDEGELTLDVTAWALQCRQPIGSEPGNCPHLNKARERAGLQARTQ